MSNIYSFLSNVWKDLLEENKQNKAFIPFVLLLITLPISMAINNILLGVFFISALFYIGKNSDTKMQIAKRKDDSFMWVLDEHLQNSFYLQTSDDNLDIKLIQLFKLLDKSINAVLFAEVTFDSN